MLQNVSVTFVRLQIAFGMACKIQTYTYCMQPSL